MLWAGTGASRRGASCCSGSSALGHLVNPRYVSDPATIGARIVELAAEGEILAPRRGHDRRGGRRLRHRDRRAGHRERVRCWRRPGAGTRCSSRSCVGFYSIPKIALAPLFILWFGLGTRRRSSWPRCSSTSSCSSTPPPASARCSRASSRCAGCSARPAATCCCKITLPSAAPAIVASIRITVTRAIEGTLLSEFVASTQGLGYLVARASREFDIATVFAGIVIIAAVVMAANGLLRLASRGLHRGTADGSTDDGPRAALRRGSPSWTPPAASTAPPPRHSAGSSSPRGSASSSSRWSAGSSRPGP